MPDVLKRPVIEMLQSLDFVTYRENKNGDLAPWGNGETKATQEWRRHMESLQNVLNNLERIQNEEDLSKYNLFI